MGLCQIRSLRKIQRLSCIAMPNRAGISNSCFSCRNPPMGVRRRVLGLSPSPCLPSWRMLDQRAKYVSPMLTLYTASGFECLSGTLEEFNKMMDIPFRQWLLP